MDTRASLPTSSTAVARPGTRYREVEHGGLTWIDLVQPTSPDIAELRERFGFDPLPLENAVSTVRRPRLDVYPEREYMFVELHVPALDRDSAIVPVEVGIFAGRGIVATVHEGEVKPLRRIFQAAATDDLARAQLLGRGPGYLLYRIVDALLKQVFPVLYQIDDTLAQLDARLGPAPPPGAARELAHAQRDIASIRAIVRPNQEVLDRLRGLPAPFLRIDAEHYFGDSAQLAAKIWDLLDEHVDVVASLNTAFGNLAIERSSRTAQLAVILLIVLVPLALIAALAGLNTAAPLLEGPLVFVGLALAGAAVAVGLLAYARHRGVL